MDILLCCTFLLSLAGTMHDSRLSAPEPWVGVVTVYAPEDGIATLSVESTYLTFSSALVPPSPIPRSPPEVTIRDGQIVSFAYLFPPMPGWWTWERNELYGMSAHVSRVDYDGIPVNGFATLTPIASHAPEPATWALLAFGLLFLISSRILAAQVSPYSQSSHIRAASSSAARLARASKSFSASLVVCRSITTSNHLHPAGLEPARLSASAFKAAASTSSATGAITKYPSQEVASSLFLRPDSL